MKFYNEKAEEVLERLGSSQQGLTNAESEARLERDGKNKLVEPKKESLVKRFFKQLADPMIIILLVSAVISGVTAAYANESFADVFIILFVVIMNSILGVVQESKAEQAIEALKKMTLATSKVIRDGKIELVNSEDIVKGDIVILEAGDSVPADGRIIESNSMTIEESVLTGESVPSEKYVHEIEHDGDVPLGDRHNMCYMGSTVAYGRGLAVITATGMETEMGKIANALNDAKDEKTPLQLRLAQLSKILTYLVLCICAVIFLVGIVRNGSFTVPVIIDSFMIAVSLAVAAIPEGLVAVVTIVLSIGVTKMSKRNAVIRKLTAVETLGCTQVICSDKTGTLTQNKMTVVDYRSSDEQLLAKAMALCSDAELDDDHNAQGEPTEAALVNYAYKIGLNKTNLAKTCPRIGEAPFDSMRKLMSTVHSENGRFFQYTKGAPDEVVKKSNYILEDGEVKEFTPEKKTAVLGQMTEMANQALRVLAAAYREYDSEPESYGAEDLEKDMIYIGQVGMIDPIRPEVKDAVDMCKKAGINVVMITGDHKNTATAIAQQLGILREDSEVVTGAELNDISDEDFDERIKHINVYARVQPEHKVRIVKIWKKLGMITAMTGDGVNDAASIKEADIGVGMGITGTDVTKNVADMVLADDNFATIVSAVEEGRKIYDNIKKCIQFLLASNLSEVLSIFVSTLLGFTILEPVHILWINLVTDSFPALALGMEGAESDLMSKKPRSSKEGIFSNGVGLDVTYQGTVISILTLLAYVIGHFMETGTWEFVNSADGMTMAFITMSMAEIFHAFNMRSQRHSIFHLKSHNFWLYGSMILSFVLTLTVIYIPGLAKLFKFEEISIVEYLVALGLGFMIVPVVEIVKYFQRKAESKALNK
ncbi:MAG: cation-translocating P-type ATPase [Clostridia bacterium]|nr:cation-translocating P-type ATPase [Clostridia bacterium]